MKAVCEINVLHVNSYERDFMPDLVERTLMVTSKALDTVIKGMKAARETNRLIRGASYEKGH